MTESIPTDLQLSAHIHLLTVRQREVLPILDGERWVQAREFGGREVGNCMTRLSKTPLVESYIDGPRRWYWITPLGCAVVDMLENG